MSVRFCESACLYAALVFLEVVGDVCLHLLELLLRVAKLPVQCEHGLADGHPDGHILHVVGAACPRLYVELVAHRREECQAEVELVFQELLPQRGISHRHAALIALQVIGLGMYPKADVVVAVSSGIADDLEAKFHVSSNVKVIYNPVSISDQVQSLSHEEQELINNIRNQGGKILINVGRVTDAKGQFNLVKAMTHLPENMHLLLIGEGEDVQRVKTLIHEQNLTERVHLLGYKTNVSAWMTSADRYVSMSWFEGFPTVFIESIKSQTPVVSADVYAGPREILSNGTLRDYKANLVYPVVLQNGVLSERFDFTKIDDTGMQHAEKAFANAVMSSFDYEFNLESSFLNIEDVQKSYLEIL